MTTFGDCIMSQENMAIFQYPLLVFLVLVPLSSTAEELICGYSEKINNNVTRYVDVQLNVSNEIVSDLFIRGSIVPGKGGDMDLCDLNTSEKLKSVKLVTTDKKNVEIVTNSWWHATSSARTRLEVEQTRTKDGSIPQTYNNLLEIERIGTTYKINLENAHMMICDFGKDWPLEVTIEKGSSVCKVKYRQNLSGQKGQLLGPE